MANIFNAVFDVIQHGKRWYNKANIEPTHPVWRGQPQGHQYHVNLIAGTQGSFFCEIVAFQLPLKIVFL